MAAATTELNRFIAPTEASPRANVGFFTRLANSVAKARMRAAEREIARLIELKGGRLTDDLERQIERTFI